MANQVMPNALEAFATGEIDWETGVIKAVGVDTGAYTFSSAHEFLSSVPGAARIYVSGPLDAKTFADGVLDAADELVAAVAGASVEAVYIVQSSAPAGGGDLADTAQRLVCWIDTATGLPVSPNGGDINHVWDNGANRIMVV